MAARARVGAAHVAIAIVLTCLCACRRRHVHVESVPELGYPTCGAQTLPAGEVLAAGYLRAGPTSLERSVVEHFEIRARDCLVIATVRQEWPLGVADVEVVYDRDRVPLRIWKRSTIPGVRRADGQADTRRYELRTPEVTIKHRGSDGRIEYEILRGGRPAVVIGPGRGLFTMWLQRARLAPGAAVRELAIDVREQLEVIREVTLRREPDMLVPWLGHNARVYTVYGREPIFADEHDVVIGDLSGLRPDATLGTPAPAPMPLYGAPDPVHTP